jgi:hypothetical protein
MSVPDHFSVDVDLAGGLGINITQVPRLTLGIDPVTINPLEVWLGLKEVPRIRVHLPANFSICLSLLGRELLALKLCGEGQVISEPYVPGPCEEYGWDKDRLRPVLKLRTDE